MLTFPLRSSLKMMRDKHICVQIEDLRLSLARMEKDHNRREEMLKQEISDLQMVSILFCVLLISFVPLMCNNRQQFCYKNYFKIMKLSSAVFCVSLQCAQEEKSMCLYYTMQWLCYI